MQKSLRNLSAGWKEENGKLTLLLELENFMACVEKIIEIAKIAEEKDHHPNICIKNYKNLEIEIFTQSESALTDKDFELAKALDEILQ